MTDETKQELSEFIGETYIANQKAVEDVGKSTNQVEKEKREQREQINAWMKLIDELY